MPTEEETVRPSVIKRWECETCGATPIPRSEVHPKAGTMGYEVCEGPLVERVYWAADEVLAELRGDPHEGSAWADFLERRFSGEGAS